MTLNENNFIKLLKKSDNFLINQIFSKVRNAKPVAIYEDTQSIIFKNPKDNKFYYASYEINEDTINLNDVEKMVFENKDYKKEIRESVDNLFTKDYDKHLKNLKVVINDIIKEDDETEVRINKKITEFLKEDGEIFINKPKFKINNVENAKKSLLKLKENEHFKDFISGLEKKFSTSVITEEINWDKTSSKIYIRNTGDNDTSHSKGYNLRGFKKAQINAKSLWKDKLFREHIGEAIEDNKKLSVFTEAHKNITLLNENELNELLSKTLLAVCVDNKIDDKLKIIKEAIKNNKDMLRWNMLIEQPVPTGELATGETATADIGGPMPGVEGAVGAPESMEPTATPDEMALEPSEAGELGTEEELATESTDEVAIVNALLSTIEDIFWNGNQENKELANLIKELRDMRVSGSFDEERLEEIFKDLFAVTQQIESTPEEEVPAGEETPEEKPIEGEGEMPSSEEIPGAETPSAGEIAAPSPLATY